MRGKLDALHQIAADVIGQPPGIALLIQMEPMENIFSRENDAEIFVNQEGVWIMDNEKLLQNPLYWNAERITVGLASGHRTGVILPVIHLIFVIQLVPDPWTVGIDGKVHLPVGERVGAGQQETAGRGETVIERLDQSALTAGARNGGQPAAAYEFDMRKRWIKQWVIGGEYHHFAHSRADLKPAFDRNQVFFTQGLRDGRNLLRGEKSVTSFCGFFQISGIGRKDACTVLTMALLLIFCNRHGQREGLLSGGCAEHPYADRRAGDMDAGQKFFLQIAE